MDEEAAVLRELGMELDTEQSPLVVVLIRIGVVALERAEFDQPVADVEERFVLQAVSRNDPELARLVGDEVPLLVLVGDRHVRRRRHSLRERSYADLRAGIEEGLGLFFGRFVLLRPAPTTVADRNLPAHRRRVRFAVVLRHLARRLELEGLRLALFHQQVGSLELLSALALDDEVVRLPVEVLPREFVGRSRLEFQRGVRLARDVVGRDALPAAGLAAQFDRLYP